MLLVPPASRKHCLCPAWPLPRQQTQQRDGADLDAARAEALGHIWARSIRGGRGSANDASQGDHRLAVNISIGPAVTRQNWKYRLLKDDPRPVTRAVNNRRSVVYALKEFR
jgi:hypothetical protein